LEQDGDVEQQQGAPKELANQGVASPARFRGHLVRGHVAAADEQSAIEVAKNDPVWSQRLGLYELRHSYLWKAVLIEVFCTFGMVMTSIGVVLSSFGRQPGPDQAPVINPPTLTIAVCHFFVLMLFIFSFAAPSGGHMNPLITFSTVLTGHTPLARGVVYVPAQLLGAVLGSLVMRAALPEATTRWTENSLGQGALGGCAAGPDLSPGQQFLLEFAFSLFLICCCYGCAFDERQGRLFGPILGPAVISAALALCIFASGNLARESSGAGMNPARCFGPAVVMGGSNLDNQWAYWAGPFAAATLNAFVYWLAPPHHKAIYDEQKQSQSKTV